MPELTHSVTELIDEFAKMPGIGRKSADAGHLGDLMSRFPVTEWVCFGIMHPRSLVRN